MSMELHYIIHSRYIFLPLLTFSVEQEKAYLFQVFSFSLETMENAMDIQDQGLFSSRVSVGLLFPGGHTCTTLLLCHIVILYKKSVIMATLDNTCISIITCRNYCPISYLSWRNVFPWCLFPKDFS